MAVWLYLQKGSKVANVNGVIVAEHNGYRHLWKMGMHEHKGDSAWQTESLLISYEETLQSFNATLADNCIRTWFFVRDVDTPVSYTHLDAAANLNYTPENAASWRNYSLQVAKLLQKDATTLYDSWETSFQGGEAFKKTFIEHNGGTYTSALSCIEQIIDKCVEITDEVGNSKIGDPYNKWTAGQQTEALYACLLYTSRCV